MHAPLVSSILPLYPHNFSSDLFVTTLHEYRRSAFTLFIRTLPVPQVEYFLPHVAAYSCPWWEGPDFHIFGESQLI